MPLEYQYLVLFSLLLLLPAFFIRIKIPIGITCLGIGIICAHFLLFKNDSLVIILAQLGITSLFLFAGMEVDFAELKKDALAIISYVSIALLLIAGFSYIFFYFFNIPYRAALLFSTGLFTPSAGFILSSLKSYGFGELENHWIKIKGIAHEVVSIIVLFFALKSNSVESLLVSNAMLAGLIILLPFIFRFFLKYLAPYAPQSEVTFLIFMALICGIFTKKIGAYYLIGAFIAGIMAGSFKHYFEEKEYKKLFNALGAFYAVFVPFYFFKAGLGVKLSYFSLHAFMLAALLFVVVSFLRVAMCYINMKFFLPKSTNKKEIAFSLLPTLIFGLVIVNILKDNFEIPEFLLGSMIIYTIANSLIPGLLFKNKMNKKPSDDSSDEIIYDSIDAPSEEAKSLC